MASAQEGVNKGLGDLRGAPCGESMEAPPSALPGLVSSLYPALGPTDDVLYEHLQLVSSLLPTPESPAHYLWKDNEYLQQLTVVSTYCVPGTTLSNLWS